MSPRTAVMPTVRPSKKRKQTGYSVALAAVLVDGEGQQVDSKEGTTVLLALDPSVEKKDAEIVVRAFAILIQSVASVTTLQNGLPQ